MSSWRHTASAQAQEDLDELLNAVLGFAQQQLSAHGEFYPYAAAIDAEREVVTIAARPDPNDEHPRSADVVAACLGTLRDRRQRIRAGAIVTDVRLQDGGDAIRLDLEHAEGHAHTVLQPYTKKRLRPAPRPSQATTDLVLTLTGASAGRCSYPTAKSERRFDATLDIPAANPPG